MGLRPTACTTALSPEGPSLALATGGVPAAGWTAADAAAWPAWHARLQRFARLLHGMLAAPPPRLGTEAWSDRIALAKVGLKLENRKAPLEVVVVDAQRAEDVAPVPEEGARLVVLEEAPLRGWPVRGITFFSLLIMSATALSACEALFMCLVLLFCR